MMQPNLIPSKLSPLKALFAGLILAIVVPMSVSGLTPLPAPEPQPGAYGLEATKPKPPPTVGARISTPGNGSSFSSSPITVRGICPEDLLVQVYNNDVLVGSVMCDNGSFSLDVSLFVGVNELSAIVYDELGQAGPRSNVVRVNFNNTNFSAFGELITLTSSYGRRSAAVSSPLTWPLQLSGGTGPYAFSIDWGDGTDADLMSQSSPGVVNISHVYKRAGIYRINIRVTDTNDVSAFLQVVAVSNGQVDSSEATDEEDGSSSRIIILWLPAAIALSLLIPAYWLGRRSQLVSIRNKMLKERDSYQQK